MTENANAYMLTLLELLKKYRRAVWQECLAAGEDTGESIRSNVAHADIVLCFMKATGEHYSVAENKGSPGLPPPPPGYDEEFYGK